MMNRKMEYIGKMFKKECEKKKLELNISNFFYKIVIAEDFIKMVIKN